MLKTFIVLGSHRSATSFVAKGLHEAGVDMGTNLVGPGIGNPEGHYEDIDFLTLNDTMLSASGGSWRQIPPVIDGDFSEEVRELLERKQGETHWGWKDPRTSLTIDKYYDKLDDPILVCCFRDPKKVGQSFKRRGDMNEKAGEALARQYNRRLIDFLTEKFT